MRLILSIMMSCYAILMWCQEIDTISSFGRLYVREIWDSEHYILTELTDDCVHCEQSKIYQSGETQLKISGYQMMSFPTSILLCDQGECVQLSFDELARVEERFALKYDGPYYQYKHGIYTQYYSESGTVFEISEYQYDTLVSSKKYSRNGYLVYYMYKSDKEYRETSYFENGSLHEERRIDYETGYSEKREYTTSGMIETIERIHGRGTNLFTRIEFLGNGVKRVSTYENGVLISTELVEE